MNNKRSLLTIFLTTAIYFSSCTIQHAKAETKYPPISSSSFDEDNTNKETITIEDILQLQRDLSLEPNNKIKIEELRQKIDALQAIDHPSREFEKNNYDDFRLENLGQQAWYSISLGFDSNINSSTNLQNLEIPLLNYKNLEIPSLLQAKKSSFLGLRGGYRLLLPLNNSWMLNGDFTTEGRLNKEAIDYLPHSHSLRYAISHQNKYLSISVATGSKQHWLSNHKIIESNPNTLTASTTISRFYLLTAQAYKSNNKYPEFLNATTYEAGYKISVKNLFSGSFIELSSGSEKSKSSPTNIDSIYHSLSFGGVLKPSSNSHIATQCKFERRSFERSSPLFLQNRRDINTLCLIGYEKSHKNNWHWGPSIAFEVNKSSLALMSYKRIQLALSFRKDLN